MQVTKRRMLLGVAGVLAALMISAPVAAAGANHGTVDVTDVTGDAHGGLVNGSDGNERNINFFANFPVGSSGSLRTAFLYEETVEFNPNIGTAPRYVTYDEPTDPINGR